ncbi:hypothetical protein MKW94_007150 [Papaver nudicaule]|uniref:Ammonium transporter AmtB-like domain-containing protein n=1 Tax=Papaver nudicaule TaxID=74823 RepID=A0AA41S1T4_PAPNU|nr:hypothetical protein [Papaver nudicaule]
MATPFFPMATLVYFQFVFAAITLILLAGSLLGRMNFKAWMVFVPLWLTFSYTIGAFSMWGGGFLFHWGVMDYAGDYVIHLSSALTGLDREAQSDREDFQPNNILVTLMGAGLLWMGWSGFNGGAPYAVNLVASMAVLFRDMELLCTISWFPMMILLHKRSKLLQNIDDTLGMFQRFFWVCQMLSR